MPPPNPYIVYGTVTKNGSTQGSVTVTITNLTAPRQGSDTRTTDASGNYIYDDLALLPNGYASGDSIKVSLNDGFSQTFTAASSPEEKLVNLTYFAQTCTESVSASDLVPKQPQRTLSDSVTDSDVIAKLPTKVSIETVTISDALSKNSIRSIIESIAVTDTLLRVASLYRTLNENIAETDTLNKQINRLFSDSITETDVFNAFKVVVRVLTEAIVSTDSLQKLTGRSFAESIVEIDTLYRLRYLLLIDAINEIDSMLKQPNKALLDQIAPTDLLESYKYKALNLIDQLILAEIISPGKIVDGESRPKVIMRGRVQPSILIKERRD